MIRSRLPSVVPRLHSDVRMSTIRTAIFLIAGKLDLRVINPHAPQLT